jgi:hypothetical protein
VLLDLLGDIFGHRSDGDIASAPKASVVREI